MLFREWYSIVIFPCLWLQVLDYVFFEDYEFVCYAVPVFVVSTFSVKVTVPSSFNET